MSTVSPGPSKGFLDHVCIHYQCLCINHMQTYLLIHVIEVIVPFKTQLTKLCLFFSICFFTQPSPHQPMKFLFIPQRLQGPGLGHLPPLESCQTSWPKALGPSRLSVNHSHSETPAHLAIHRFGGTHNNTTTVGRADFWEI